MRLGKYYKKTLGPTKFWVVTGVGNEVRGTHGTLRTMVIYHEDMLGYQFQYVRNKDEFLNMFEYYDKEEIERERKRKRVEEIRSKIAELNVELSKLTEENCLNIESKILDSVDFYAMFVNNPKGRFSK